MYGTIAKVIVKPGKADEVRTLATRLEITARKKVNWFSVADPSDFEFIEGPTVDPRIILSNPLISLYCLDHPNRRALFVETTPGVDLSQAPFLYYAQYENTVRLFAVPYEMLHQLAGSVSLDDRRLILVYSTGRSGSTLLGSALNAAEGIVGLSEPDVFTQLVAYRQADGSSEAEISSLVESCLKIQCKPTEQIPNPAGWVIKFRSFSIELGDLLYEHFPHTKNIFLYRHAEAYLNSILRAFGDNEDDIGYRTGIQGWLSTLVPPVARHVQAGGSLLSFASIGAMLWLRTMERYVEHCQAGMPGIAIRYEDLKTVPHQVLQNIFAFYGLPTASMDAVYQVLQKDSQAGSAISQETLNQKKSGLKEAQRADLLRELQKHPTIQSPEYIVPATWLPAANGAMVRL